MASPPPPAKPRRLRSILLRPKTPPAAASNTPSPRRKGFAAAAMAFRGLGCSTSSVKVHTPSRSRGKKKRGEEEGELAEGGLPRPRETSAVNETGIGFHEDEEVADEAIGSDRYSGERQRGTGRRSLLGSPRSHVESPVFGSELGLPRHLRRSWRLYGSPSLLEELMMFDAGLLLGEMDIFDRFRYLRLDVDEMSYEELLELGDTIGHVNTGLREDEIVGCLRKTKHSIFDSLMHLSADTNCKCSICLEEYGVGDDVGKLGCGHSYHSCCIKQWLLRKNSCPVCKAAVARNK